MQPFYYSVCDAYCCVTKRYLLLPLGELGLGFIVFENVKDEQNKNIAKKQQLKTTGEYKIILLNYKETADQYAMQPFKFSV